MKKLIDARRYKIIYFPLWARIVLSIGIVVLGIFFLSLVFHYEKEINILEQQSYDQQVQLETHAKQIPHHAEFLKIITELEKVAGDKMTPKQVVEVSEVISAMCIAHQDLGLTSAKIFAMIERESNFDPMAISPQRAYGLMQLIRPTFEMYLEDIGYAKFSKTIALDPVVNVKAGIEHLVYLRSYWLEEDVDSWMTVMNSYFWGIRTTWELFLSKRRARLPSMEYGKNILDLTREWKERGLN